MKDSPHKADLYDDDPFFAKGLPSEIGAERSILGAILLDQGSIAGILDQSISLAPPESFFLDSHRKIYRAMISIAARGEPIDMITLSSELRLHSQLEAVQGGTYIASLIDGVPRTDTVKPYAKLVAKAALKRKLISACQDITQRAFGDEEVEEIVLAAEEQIFALSESRRLDEGPEHVAVVGGRLADFYEQKSADPAALIGLSTGFKDIDRMTLGLTPGITLVAARPRAGKAQPLDARILTRQGWSTMGDLQVGDALASVDGRESKVEEIYPQGEKQIYRVTFSDGRSMECCGEHLWYVRSCKWEYPRTLSTLQIRRLLKRVRYKSRLTVDLFQGDFASASDDSLPLDPWLLGVLIGDGTLKKGTPSLSTADREILSRVQNLIVPMGLTAVYNGQYDYRLSRLIRRGREANSLMAILKNLGLQGLGSEEKFIPSIYQTASAVSRRLLLQGLLDTDGTVEKKGTVSFTSVSRRLSDDVVDLVRSLGGVASQRDRITHYAYNGKKRDGQRSYTSSISLGGELFTLTRKLNRLPQWRRQRPISFKSIWPSRIAEARCIRVSHPRRLYVTDNYIVTHNTSLCTNIACNVAESGGSVYFASIESSSEKIVQRILSSMSRIDSYRLRQGYLNKEEWAKLADVLRNLAITRFVIDDTPDLTPEQLASRCRQYKAQNGLDLIVLDYIQLMARRLMYRRRYKDLRIAVQEVGAGLVDLSRRLEVPVLVVAQLSREVDQRPDHHPQLSDLAESASLEADSDIVLAIYREEMYKPTDENAGLAKAIFLKQRDGAEGEVDLAFIKAYTRFEDLAYEARPDTKNYKRVRGSSWGRGNEESDSDN